MSAGYDFAALLEVPEQDLDGGTAARPSFFFDPLALAETAGSSIGDRFAAAEYAIALEPVVEPFQEPEPLSVDPAEIAAELNLAGLDAPSLATARREFARRNHPDRNAGAAGAAALTRMQIANALIDEAEKTLSQRGS